jgi:hypothetical protein
MVTRHSLPRTLADLDTLAFAEPLDVDELAAVATSFRASGFLVDIVIHASNAPLDGPLGAGGGEMIEQAFPEHAALYCQTKNVSASASSSVTPPRRKHETHSQSRV